MWRRRKQNTLWILVIVLLATVPSWCQYHSLHLQGWGGLGMGYSNLSGGAANRSSTSDRFEDVSVSGDGFLYSPELLQYTAGTSWTGNHGSDNTATFGASDWNYNLGLGFLSARSFPFSLELYKTTTNNDGSLIPTSTSTSTGWNLHGTVTRNPVADFAYSLGEGSSSSQIAETNIQNTWNRHASVSATRRLDSWQLRVRDEYTKRTGLQDYDTNDLVADGSRTFGEKINLNLNASRMTSSIQSSEPGQASNGSASTAGASVSWHFTKRLDSYCSVAVGQSAVNTLELLSAASGSTVNLPYSPHSVDSKYYNANAGLSYWPTSSLSLGLGVGRSGNNVPDEASIPVETRSTVTTATEAINANANFHHKCGKFSCQLNGSVGTQRFYPLSGSPTMDTNFGAGGGMGGGDVRTLAYALSADYSRFSGAVFFNRSSSTGERASLQLSSNRLKFVQVQAYGQFSNMSIEFVQSNSTSQSKSFGASGNFPKRNVSVFYSHNLSDSNSKWLTLNSVVLQPGGSTGGTLLPENLFSAPIFSASNTQQLGVNWRPRYRLEIQGHWVQNYFKLFNQTSTWVNDGHLDVMVQYKFGRFTLYGLWSHSDSKSYQYILGGDRFRFQVRFPFHLLG